MTIKAATVRAMTKAGPVITQAPAGFEFTPSDVVVWQHLRRALRNAADRSQTLTPCQHDAVAAQITVLSSVLSMTIGEPANFWVAAARGLMMADAV